ncbi:RNA polymerase sigma-70 factor (ECF subfamily) [Lipingzhangella halophila]|uniref:RNA polymerase sigma-70 factor (ECF subfamily) n=1 Tax=Lipingzhangella halophila TaxID=1783352 RepID=A0A7W7RNE6_9ACTN|nr:sigma-70 family RNA polymerase sigma factor [Lipingzhangella halophila]MBB4935194.1 RNA polymerase sigma-70 factor (ECF subfamily) [Lipingzhangella halophila]
MPSSEERIAAVWSRDRRYLHAVAARVLGDRTEAEDVVQDAFARLALQPVDALDDPRAWLLVAVRRLALDRLRSARLRLSEPTDTADLAARTPDSGADPADRVTLDDEVRSALGLVLDRLTPAQRTVFLLHDVFGVPFDGIAELVGRTPAACRQLARQARKSVRGGARQPAATPVPSEASTLSAVAKRFADACAGGDLDALARLLDPRVSGWATIGGRRVGLAEGIATVAERTLRFLGPGSGWHLTPIPLDEGVGLLVTRRSEPVAVVRLDVREERVRSLHAVVLER